MSVVASNAKTRMARTDLWGIEVIAYLGKRKEASVKKYDGQAKLAV